MAWKRSAMLGGIHEALCTPGGNNGSPRSLTDRAERVIGFKESFAAGEGGGLNSAGGVERDGEEGIDEIFERRAEVE